MPNLSPKISEIQFGNWASAVNFSRDVQKAIHKLSSFKLGPSATPSFGSFTLTDLTASRLVATNSSQTLVSASNLASWVSGTANEIDIADDGDGTITIGLVNPLIVGKGGTGLATLTDHSILLGSGTDAVTPLGVASNGQLPIGSTGADPVLSVLTEGSGISITNGAGSITIAASAGGIDHNSLSGLQGGTTAEYYHLTSTEHGYVSGVNAQSVLTTATPQFAGLGIATGSPLGLLHVGDGTENNSVDVACLVSRSLSGGSGNAHGFSDSSNVSRSGGIGYCAFDGRFKVTGTENFDHIVSFQAAPTYSSAGALSDCYGLYVADPTKTAGTITNNYGVYIEEQTAGATNYGLYVAGSSPNVLGGSLTVTAPEGQMAIFQSSGGLANSEVRIVGERYVCLRLESYRSAGANASLNFRRARGTAASPAAVRSGDEIGFLYGHAYNGTAWGNSCGLVCRTRGTVSEDYAVPGVVGIYTTGEESANWSQRAIFDEAGNFGVGIDPPVEMIHSAAKVRADTAFNLDGTDGVSDSGAGVPTALTVAGGIVTAVTKNDWLDQSVKVAANPTFESLTLTKALNPILKLQSNSSSATESGEIQFWSLNSDTGPRIRIVNDESSNSLRIDVRRVPADAWTSSLYIFRGAAGQEGRIGIKTSTPLTTLHVNGTGRFEDTVDIRASDGLTLRTTGSSTLRWSLLPLTGELQDGLTSAVISYADAVAGAWPFEHFGAVVFQGRSDAINRGGFAFAPNTAANGIAMAIMEDKKVGIGTTSPNELLEVAGKIRANTAFNLNGTDFLDSSGLVITNGYAKLGDGGTTNYANFATDGELTLFGTARVLKEFELNATSFAPGSSGASKVLLGHYDGWSFGIGDEVVASFEIPHDWDSSTDLILYIYWYINEAYATNSGEVQWRIQWSATPPSGTEAIDAPTHTGTIDFGDQNIPATAKFLTKSSGGTIAAASLSAGDLIGLTLDRVALDGGNNPTAEPVMVHMEVHYISNKLGEST